MHNPDLGIAIEGTGPADQSLRRAIHRPGQIKAVAIAAATILKAGLAMRRQRQRHDDVDLVRRLFFRDPPSPRDPARITGRSQRGNWKS